MSRRNPGTRCPQGACVWCIGKEDTTEGTSMTALSDRLRADADRNTVSGDSGFSNEVMRDLQETAKLEREAADALLSITQDYIGMCDVVREKERQLAEAQASRLQDALNKVEP